MPVKFPCRLHAFGSRNTICGQLSVYLARYVLVQHAFSSTRALLRSLRMHSINGRRRRDRLDVILDLLRSTILCADPSQGHSENFHALLVTMQKQTINIGMRIDLFVIFQPIVTKWLLAAYSRCSSAIHRTQTVHLCPRTCHDVSNNILSCRSNLERCISLYSVSEDYTQLWPIWSSILERLEVFHFDSVESFMLRC